MIYRRYCCCVHSSPAAEGWRRSIRCSRPREILERPLEVEGDGAGTGTPTPTDHLTLDYQPKLDCKSRQVYGVEALVRWQHPTRGIIMPDNFIPAH